MSRNWLLYLQDIIDATQKIEAYVQGLSREQFFCDGRTVDATIRNLEIIGEAAKRIPVEHRSNMSTIPWLQLSAMRNILAHAYFGIDEDILWDVVSNHVPVLERTAKAYFQSQVD